MTYLFWRMEGGGYFFVEVTFANTIRNCNGRLHTQKNVFRANVFPFKSWIGVMKVWNTDHGWNPCLLCRPINAKGSELGRKQRKLNVLCELRSSCWYSIIIQLACGKTEKIVFSALGSSGFLLIHCSWNPIIYYVQNYLIKLFLGIKLLVWLAWFYA